MTFLLTALVFAVADRLRGTYSIAVWPMALIFGWMFPFNKLNPSDYWEWSQDLVMLYNMLPFNLFMTLAFVAGEAPGWGNPLGAYLKKMDFMPSGDAHWWQVGKLSENVGLAMLARGVLWGLPPAIAGYCTGVVHAPFLLLVITGSWLLSPVMVVKLTNKSRPQQGIYNYRKLNRKFADKIWPLQEWSRGFMFGMGFYVISTTQIS